MKGKKETCKNCEKQFKESFKFCPYCGQQAKDELTIKLLFYNTISNYFSFDARFFKSFLPLLFKPGYLASKFIEGKRLLYLHPAQMYLFITVVFFFLFSFIQRDQVRSLDTELAKTLKKDNVDKSELNKDSLDISDFINQKQDGALESVELTTLKKKYGISSDISEKEIDSILRSENFKANSLLDADYKITAIDSLIQNEVPNEEIYKKMGMSDNAGFFEKRIYAQGLKFYRSRKGGSVLQAFYDAIPIALFFLLPIFALILKFLNLKRGLYAHHLVFSFYYFSFLFTVFSVVIALNFIFDIPDSIDWLVVLSTFIYLLIAIKYFYRQSWLKSVLKTIVTSFSFLLLVTPLTVLILAIFAFLFH